jgi:hypothetical protein
LDGSTRSRKVPAELEVRHRSGRKHKVDGIAIACDLVGDRDVAASRIANRRSTQIVIHAQRHLLIYTESTRERDSLFDLLEVPVTVIPKIE